MNEENVFKIIANEQKKIDELNYIKERLKKTDEKDIRLKIETKHWYGFTEPILCQEKHKLNISKDTIEEIIDEIIRKTEEKMNNLIENW